MGFWVLLQVVIDIFAALGFFLIIMRMTRQPKDDPRLSRGLQLLQSKIAVLEDLSDRTETQVSQLAAILEQKGKEVQAKVQLAEQQVQEIRISMERSLEVAKMFQDKIPHQEIIERQNSIKYVQAARLAHQGLNADEIARQVDLPKGEIEFIAKVNRDQLMFNEDGLPWWAKESATAAATSAPLQPQMSQPSPFEAPAPKYQPHSHQRANLGHLDFIETVDAHPMQAAQDAADQAAHQQAEVDLAERQRLVENLSRLQNEMHKLDLQLDKQIVREVAQRDQPLYIESAPVEATELQKLGDEFRRACDEAANARPQPSATLPPLEQVAAVIPSFLPPEPQPAPVPTGPLENELARARAVAREISAMEAAPRKFEPIPVPPPTKPVAPQTYMDQNGPVVRKVQFPRIDSPMKG